MNSTFWPYFNYDFSPKLISCSSLLLRTIFAKIALSYLTNVVLACLYNRQLSQALFSIRAWAELATPTIEQTKAADKIHLEDFKAKRFIVSLPSQYQKSFIIFQDLRNCLNNLESNLSSTKSSKWWCLRLPLRA